MKIYFAADHAGFQLKEKLRVFVKELGHEEVNCGAESEDPSDDYPAFIAAAAKRLSEDARSGIESRAIVIGASGQGEAMVANRFKGVRCALYYGEATKQQTDMSGKQLKMLESTREHNNANALSLGARFLGGDEEVKQAVKLWLDTPFSGEERHARRIRAIDAIA